MRRAHFVKENKTTEYPQQCIWFDCETTQQLVCENTVEHWLSFGYACYMRRHHGRDWTDEEWFKFTTRADFWRWVSSKVREKTKLYLFCHNTSFDLPVLDVLHELPNCGFELRTAIIDAPPTILRFRNGSKCIMILDTLNLWRMPLRYLGQEIGLPKLDMPDNNDLAIEWETYARRDVEIIRTACIKWWDYLERENMGSFAPTLAGQSMKVFRHKYMKHPILIDDNKSALALTREGYYGGRVECFRIGRYKARFRSLDVNSMYPFVMAYNEFPSKLVTHTRYATVNDLSTWIQRYCVTARVRLRTHKPFVPLRDHHKLIFPVGEFEAILSTPEIKYALLDGEILEVLEVAIYERALLFTEMVTDMYYQKQKSKRDGDYVREFLYKKLLNSFYGKWGQSGGKWIELDNTDDLSCRHWIEIDYESGRMKQYRQLGGLQQMRDTEGESRDSFPAIAAHVTAHARMVLWNLIEQAGLQHTYYCDTDSLLVDDIGFKNLEYKLDEYKLGGLKVAGDYEDIEIWSSKDYRFGQKEKHKGVRKAAVWLDNHNIRQEQWSGLRGLVSSGVVDRPLTKTITKKLSRLYDKGTVLASGEVLPLVFPPNEFQDE